MTSSPHRVLVLDGEQRAALAIIRSLGRAGHSVYVCSTERHSIGGVSRFAAAELLVADALQQPAQLVEQVRAFITAYRIDVLIPVSEASLLAILPHREAFGDVCLPFPDLDTFQHITNKQLVLERAASLGISIPAQTPVATPGDVAALDLEALAYPIVVKPARSVSGETGRRAKFMVRYAESPKSLRELLTKMDPRAYPVLLQQRIVGPGTGIFVLLWDQALVAAFAHRRLREHPASGGVSVYRESAPMDDDLLAKSLRLLESFQWRGVAMVEYKIDAATGTPYLMEINGRFWGSLQLAIDAGVDFPTLLVRRAMGEPVPPVTTYDLATRSRWLWGDVSHVVTRLYHSDRALALPPGSPSRTKMLLNFFRHSSSDSYETLQADDVRPFLRETMQWFSHMGKG